MELLRGAKNYLLGSASSGGALDVIVVRLPDGTLSSSPFHVRLERREKPATVPQQRWVRLKVNGVEVGLRMKLGAAGEAFFMEPSPGDPKSIIEKASGSVNGVAATSTAATADGAATWAPSPLMSPGDATACRDREGSGVTAAVATAVAASTAEAAAAKLAGGSNWEASSAKADAATALVTQGKAASAAEPVFSATGTTPVSAAPTAVPVAASAPAAEAGDSWWWSWTWGGLPVRKDSASADKKRRRRLSGGGSIDESDVRRLSSASEADGGSLALPAMLEAAGGASSSAQEPNDSSSVGAESSTAAATADAAGGAGADALCTAASFAGGAEAAAPVCKPPSVIDGAIGAQAVNGEKAAAAELVDSHLGCRSDNTGARATPASPALAASREIDAVRGGPDFASTVGEAGNGLEKNAIDGDTLDAGAALPPSSGALSATMGGSVATRAPAAVATLTAVGAAAIEPAGGASAPAAGTAAPHSTNVPVLCEAPNELPADAGFAALQQNGVGSVAAAASSGAVLSAADAAADAAPRLVMLSEGSPSNDQPVNTKRSGQESDNALSGQGNDSGSPAGAGGAAAVSDNAVDKAGAGLAAMELISPQASSDGDFLMPLSSEGGNGGGRSVGVGAGIVVGGSASGCGGDGGFNRVTSDSGFNRNMSMDFAGFHTPCGSSLDLPAIAAASEAHETTLAAALAAAAAPPQAEENRNGSSRCFPAAVEAAPLPLLSLCGPLAQPFGEAAAGGGSGGVLGEAVLKGQDFMDHVVTLEHFLKRPKELLEDPRLVVCVGDSLYPFQEAIPLLVAAAAFGRGLPAINSTAAAVPAPPAAAAASWAGSRGWSEHLPPALPVPAADGPVNGLLVGVTGAVGSSAASEAHSTNTSAEAVNAAAAATAAAGASGAASRSSRRWLQWLPPLRGSSVDRLVSEGGSVSAAEDTLTEAISSVTGSVTAGNGTGDVGSGGGMHVKTLRPTAAQLASLGLHEGANLVEFALAGADGAAVAVMANVFLWDSDARIVVADLDGAVACGGDVPGLASFVPVAGPAIDKGSKKLLWGVANNGYKLVYLSSKPPTLQAKPYIKMAPVLAPAAAATSAPAAAAGGGGGGGGAAANSSTAGSNGGSGGASAAAAAGAMGQLLPAKPPLPSPAALPLPAVDGGLPVGPVLCTPEALLPGGARIVSSSASAETRAFVTAALQGLAQLFPRGVNPLYAGLGADSSEAEAFRRCGVPPGRALVCRGGELRGLNRTFRRSVESATTILDEIFPPLPGASGTQSAPHGGGSGGSRGRQTAAAEDAYADANFWREPPQLITSDDEDN